MMKGETSMRGKIVENGRHAYQRTVHVFAIRHDYGEGNYKWTCPVCDQFNNNHQILQNTTNCPSCGINLCWDDD